MGYVVNHRRWILEEFFYKEDDIPEDIFYIVEFGQENSVFCKENGNSDNIIAIFQDLK